MSALRPYVHEFQWTLHSSERISLIPSKDVDLSNALIGASRLQFFQKHRELAVRCVNELDTSQPNLLRRKVDVNRLGRRCVHFIGKKLRKFGELTFHRLFLSVGLLRLERDSHAVHVSSHLLNAHVQLFGDVCDFLNAYAKRRRTSHLKFRQVALLGVFAEQIFIRRTTPSFEE